MVGREGQGSTEAASFWVWFVPAVLGRQTDGQEPLLESRRQSSPSLYGVCQDPVTRGHPTVCGRAGARLSHASLGTSRP